MKQQKPTFWTNNLFKMTLAGLLFVGITSAQPLLAAEMPCVKEVCIGDGLDKLRGVPFKAVNLERAQRLSERRRIEHAEMFGGFQAETAPAYILLGEFDVNALGDMAKIKTACHPLNGLEGTYVSESGYRTNVQVALWPDKSGNMKWLVKSISRAYKDVKSGNESNQLIQDLQQKYAKWDMGKVGQPKPGQAGMMLVPVHEPILTLILAPTAEVISPDNYKKNPLCKSSKKVNLD